MLLKTSPAVSVAIHFLPLVLREKLESPKSLEENEKVLSLLGILLEMKEIESFLFTRDTETHITSDTRSPK